MGSFSHHLADETAALRRRVPVVIPLLVVVAFGILLPWQKGVGFLDPVILGAYACFGVVFSGPASSYAIEKSDPRARVLVSVLYGELLVLGIILATLTTIYTTRHVYVGPDLESLAMCALFGLALSLAVSTIAAWMSLQYSPSAARGVVRLVFLALLAGFFLRARRLPAAAPWGAGIALAVATVAYLRLRAAISERA
jgi:hypothetical protein